MSKFDTLLRFNADKADISQANFLNRWLLDEPELFGRPDVNRSIKISNTIDKIIGAHWEAIDTENYGLVINQSISLIDTVSEKLQGYQRIDVLITLYRRISDYAINFVDNSCESSSTTKKYRYVFVVSRYFENRLSETDQNTSHKYLANIYHNLHNLTTVLLDVDSDIQLKQKSYHYALRAGDCYLHELQFENANDLYESAIHIARDGLQRDLAQKAQQKMNQTKAELSKK